MVNIIAVVTALVIVGSVCAPYVSNRLDNLIYRVRQYVQPLVYAMVAWIKKLVRIARGYDEGQEIMNRNEISALVTEIVAMVLAKIGPNDHTCDDTVIADLPTCGDPSVCMADLPSHNDANDGQTVVARVELPVKPAVESKPVTYVGFNRDGTIGAIYRPDLRMARPISLATFGQGPIASCVGIGSLVTWISRSGKNTNYAIVVGVASDSMPVVLPINVDTGDKAGRITRKDLGAVKTLDNPTGVSYWADSPADLPGVKPVEVKPVAESAKPRESSSPVKTATAKPSNPRITASLLTGQPTLNASTEIVVFVDGSGSISRDSNGLIHWVFPRSKNGVAALDGRHVRNSRGFTSRLMSYASLASLAN